MVTVGSIERLQPPRTSTVRPSRFGPRRALGSRPGDEEPDHDRCDGHEAHHCRDEGGQERGPVDALDGYTQKDYKGVGERESAEHGYPREYQGGRGVGRHAVDLPEVRHLPDEGPYREKVDSCYHTDPDRREQCEEDGVERRRS